jgi:putative ABC transport system permease protein
MSFWQEFVESLESLSANKMRSGLTILGIVIGVAAVISMLAIGTGAQASINTSIQSIGTNLIFVTPGAQNVRNPRPLTLQDAQALQDPFAAPDVKSMAPLLQGQATAAFGSQSQVTSVDGVTPNYESIRNLTLSAGSFVSQTDILGRFPVAVLGASVAQNLFGRTTNLVGESIQINDQSFRVIGVLQSKGGNNFGSVDDQILVPLTTAQVRLFHRSQPDQVDMIVVQATSANTVNGAVDEVTQILRSLHHISVGANDFTIINEQDILATATSITGVLTIFLGGIGGISLLVGGIGIMNIMLVSVTERTREIGLRKALGARKRDILIQFLMESSMLSLIGGALGIFLGWVISIIVGRIAAANHADIQPVITASAVLLATLFSAAVGLFFGYYPSNRAASLEPVEALRYE